MANKYPVAGRPSSVDATKAVACVHCNSPLVAGGWDKLNGFLVECPNCHGFHGKPWSIRAVALASIFVNALSFFFTMRPLRALVAIIVWAAAMYFILPRLENTSDAIEAIGFGALVLGPLLINMALLIRHNIDLDRHPMAARAA